MIQLYDADGTALRQVIASDDSYHMSEIMGDDVLVLKVPLVEYVEFPVGCYCMYRGARYSLYRPPQVKKIHSRSFEYTLYMYTDDHRASVLMFRHVIGTYTTTDGVTTMSADGGDGRLSFPLTATAKEHLQMFVDNMNKRLSGDEALWTIGACIDWDGTTDSGTEKLISYDYNYCLDALKQIADTFGTEYSFSGHEVSLGKMELRKDNPLAMTYGKGNGFKSGVGRQSESDEPPIERLYIQGSDQNIDPSKYGSKTLHLPAGRTIRYDGTYFAGQEGFVEAKQVYYTSSSDGLSVTRYDKQATAVNEGAFDATDIYPKRVGTISSVVTVDAENHLYDIVDDSIPDTLDYSDCLIEGETMTIIFQSGQLAGREFDVKYYHDAVGSKAARRFEIVPTEQDGEMMPSDTFLPAVGDTYVIFHCQLPGDYIGNNTTQLGAEWDAFRQAVVYLHQRSEESYTFSGDVDGIWAKKDWASVSPYMAIGNHVQFVDDFMPSPGVLLRVTAVKEYINDPYSLQLTLSNALVRAGLMTEFRGLRNRLVGERWQRDQRMESVSRRTVGTEDVTVDSEGILTIFGNTFKPLTPTQYANMINSFQRINDEFVEHEWFEAGYCDSDTQVCYEAEKLDILGERGTYKM